MLDACFRCQLCIESSALDASLQHFELEASDTKSRLRTDSVLAQGATVLAPEATFQRYRDTHLGSLLKTDVSGASGSCVPNRLPL